MNAVEWFAFRKFDFRIFWNLSQEISVPVVPVSKISEFLVEWKAPNDSFPEAAILLVARLLQV
jgi:hypothetical protein